MFLTIMHNSIFGDRSIRPEDVTWPGSAESSRAWLQSLHQRWHADLESLSEEELDRVGVVKVSGLHGATNRFADRSLGWVLAWANFETISMVRALGRVPALSAKLSRT